MTKKPPIKNPSANVRIPEFGWIHVEMRNGKVFSIDFKKKSVVNDADGRLTGFTKAVKKYFAGQPAALGTFKPDLSGYTPRETKILKTLCRVKPGRTISYKDLGRKAGLKSGFRFVGNTVGKNRTPILVPCHRVIKSDGTLGGFSGGLSKKVKLLRCEGHLNKGET